MDDFKTIETHFFNGLTYEDISAFDTMDKALLVKYWFIVETQFYAFEELCDHNLTGNDVEYASGEKFVDNEGEYLKLGQNLMGLYPIREKLVQIIKSNYTKDEFEGLYDNACEEYKKYVGL